MLLAICEKNWQFLHQLATILGPAIRRGTSTGRHFLTTDGRPAGRNNDEKYQQNTKKTNKFKQKQFVATAPTRNLIYSVHNAPYDESTRKFNRKKFADDGRTTYWTKQRRNTTPN